MNKRIKELRKSEGLTQQEFGERLGLRPNSVSQIESGVNTPSEQTLLSICREFNVREEWLRRGDGPMKKPQTRREAIEDFLNHVSTLPDDDFRNVLISFLAETGPEQWQLLEQEARRLSRLMPEVEEPKTLSPERQAALAEYERELRLEEEAAARSLPFSASESRDAG